MPRTTLPPTPSSSSDIHAKDGSNQMAGLQLAFELPPPAMNESPKTPYPIQPSEVVKSRKRSAPAPSANPSAQTPKNSFALPPPPTRSRKIIQMKPRTQDACKPPELAAAGPAGKGGPTTASRKSTAAPAALPAAAAVPVSNEASCSSKKKQPSATSVAGRKIARKTAHSLIERRRRSKMNEEFAVLKSMIPACTGEMHKLAILQASIEYVRYLQDCVEKLKAQREDSGLDTPTNLGDAPNETSREAYDSDREYYQTAYTPEEEEECSPDVDMTGSDVAVSPMLATDPPAIRNVSYMPTESPSLAAQDSATSPVIHRNSSYSSVCTAVDSHRHYSFSTATASPAFGPQQAPAGAGWYAHSTHSASGSTLTSPALGPSGERDLDQEVTAALLMLNSDRRGTISTMTAESNRNGGAKATKEKSRGMSVKELLSA